MSRQRILVVEDDAAIRRGLIDALQFQGYETIEAADGAAAVSQALEASPDLVVLDCMLPKQSGLEALRAIRGSRPTLPVIMVTALGSENDRVSGLSLGADDYIVKPFSLRELLARVEAVLRRSPGRPLDVTSLADGAIVVDLSKRVIEAARNGSASASAAPGTSPAPSASADATRSSAKTSTPAPAGSSPAGLDDGDDASHAGPGETPISERDVGILRHLAANRTRVVERDELLQVVWGLDPRGLETRTVDMQIARLRERIATAGARCEWIATARGKGYRLGSEVEVR